MAARYVLCPAVIDDLPSGRKRRRAKIGFMVDPGKPKVTDPLTGEDIPQGYAYRSITDPTNGALTNNWYLVLVKDGVDFTPIDSDPDCYSFDLPDSVDVERARALLRKSPNDLGLSATKKQRIAAKLDALGVDRTGLTADSQMHEWLTRIARMIKRGADADVTREL